METIYKMYGLCNNLLFNQENILDYRPGGYHPVALLDTFQDHRYQIHHKLGYGGFSTVWLTWDNKFERWVSLKILTAEQSACSRELDSFRRLENCHHAVRLYDHFIHEGPNGSHQCLVLELLGPTLDIIVGDNYADGDSLDLVDVKKMTEELLAAVAFMHSVGIAHGDLSPRNLAIWAPRLSGSAKDDLFKILGEPETESVTRMDGKPLDCGDPKDFVMSTEWPGWPDGDVESEARKDSDSYDSDYDSLRQIRLLDLGEAFPMDSEPSRVAQPTGLQAPESIFANEFSYKIDLWRAGLIIYFFTFGTMPFGWFSIDTFAASIITFAGRLPPEWRENWADFRRDSTDSFVLSIREDGHVPESSLREKIALRKDDDDAEVELLISVIEGLTRLAPSDRISASQALQSLTSKGQTGVASLS